MSEIRQLRPVGVLRPNLNDAGSLEATFQEIITDLNEITELWNDSLYPLLGSLPTQAIRRRAEQRSLDIDPFTNGFDGSQVFMDQAATPQLLGGLLHTGERPKTIKEVFIESYSSLQGKVSRLTALMNDININNSAYDDSELRNWILQLSGETFDPLEIAQGATFSSAAFAGSPAKSSLYSLNTRDKTLREVLGVEGEALNFTNISSLVPISGSNYMSATTDIIEALAALDAALDNVESGVGGVATLQTAYDNSPEDQKWIDTETLGDDPVRLYASDVDVTVLELFGALKFLDGASGLVGTTAIIQHADYSGASTDRTYNLHWSTTDATNAAHEIARLAINKGSAVTNEAIEFYLGKGTSSAAQQLASLYIGRETTGEGGRPHLTLESYYSEELEISKSRIWSPLELSIFSLTGDLRLEAGDDLILSAADVIAFTSAKFDVATSGDEILLASGTDFTASSAALMKLLSTDDSYHYSGGHNTFGAIDSFAFGVENAALGFSFKEYTTVDTSGLDTAGLTIFRGFKDTDHFAVADFDYILGAGASSNGVLYTGAVSLNAYAPLTKDGDVCGDGAPDVSRLYLNNLCKCKGVVTIDTDADAKIAITPDNAQSIYNVLLDTETDTYWDHPNSIIHVKFATQLESEYCSISLTHEAPYDMSLRVIGKSETGFSILVRIFEPTTQLFTNFVDNPTGGVTRTASIHFQVV